MSYGENGGMSATEYVALSGNNGYGRGGGLFGDDLLGLVVLAALFGGGFGGFGGGFGGGGRCGSPCATQADVRAAVDQQTLISKLDQQTYGLADSTYALNNTITSGFHGVDNAICNLGYQTQQGFNTLGYQMKDCCCETQRLIERGFADTNYNMATQFCDTRHQSEKNTRDIIDNQNCNTRAILDFLVTEKMAAKDARIAELTNQVGRMEQNSFTRATIEANTAEILRRTGHDCPTAAYLVQPPTAISFPTNGCGQVQFGYNSGCGCGNSYSY